MLGTISGLVHMLVVELLAIVSSIELVLVPIALDIGIKLEPVLVGLLVQPK